MKTGATARAESDPSKGSRGLLLSVFAFSRPQVPPRSPQGSCLIHFVPLLQDFCPMSLPGSVDQKPLPGAFSHGVCEKTGKELLLLARPFYKIEAQRVPPLSPDVGGPTVHP